VQLNTLKLIYDLHQNGPFGIYHDPRGQGCLTRLKKILIWDISNDFNNMYSILTTFIEGRFIFQFCKISIVTVEKNRLINDGIHASTNIYRPLAFTYFISRAVQLGSAAGVNCTA